MTRPDRDLIRFVQHLYDIHSTTRYGFVVADRDEREATDRCKRWLDAVIAPPPPKETMDVPFLEEKAAE
jgi:hypothetical protein